MNNIASTPLISFAIPTYNFGRFISETIESIFDGRELLDIHDVEVVVLDGGSTDNTEEVVDYLCKKYPNIKYKKKSKRGGIDRDLDEVAELASGKYIWLFSADDRLIPGWDVLVKQALSREPDIMLVPAMLCSLHMENIRPNPIFLTDSDKSIVDWLFDGELIQIENYLRSTKSLEALFGFLSAVVVKSARWDSLTKREDYYGTCWAHCARLMPIFTQQSKIIYISEMIIHKRGENDSFMEFGFVNRIAIAIDGWTRIINEFFPLPKFRRFLHSKLRSDISLLLFLYAKISTKDINDQIRLNGLAKQHYLLNSLSVTSCFSYVVFIIFPRWNFVFDIVQRNLSSLKKARHKLRAYLG
jgi:abequosyltransferase